MSNQMSRIMQGMESMMKDMIMECSKKYNFDGEEAIREVLGVRMGKRVVKEKVLKEKDNRGRPKKAPMEVESNVPVDLFATIVNEVIMEKSEKDVVDDLIAGLETMNVEEKVVDKKEVYRLKKAEEKAEKEAKREAEKAEKEAKREAEKAEKEAKRQAEKAERESKREANKAKKESDKGLKKAKKASKSEEKEEVLVEEDKELSEPSSKVEKVVRFEHNGVKYYKSLENILYDPVTKNEVGIWCEDSKSIKELPEEDEAELEEEGYESD